MSGILSGEPQLIKTTWTRLEVCCDCKLTHFVFYRVIDKKTIERTVYRDDWETLKRRKEVGVVVYNKKTTAKIAKMGEKLKPKGEKDVKQKKD